MSWKDGSNGQRRRCIKLDNEVGGYWECKVWKWPWEVLLMIRRRTRSLEDKDRENPEAKLLDHSYVFGNNHVLEVMLGRVTVS